jgi:hypothetical protein
MRFLLVTGAAAFSLLALFIFLLQRAEHRRIESAAGCRNELLLVDLWKAQRLIYEVRHDGQDIVVKTNWARWATTQRQIQVGIGKAADCPLILAGKGGMVRVEDQNDRELARVVNGVWSSTLFPE